MKLLQRLKQIFSTLYNRYYWWILPYWEKAKPWVDKVVVYFKTHPRARKASKILTPPFAFFLLLLFIVWIETPWDSELRNVRNQVASEIYSADSVLLGRYYLQDRTEVEYKDISPAVIKALVATEDVRFYEHSGVDYKSLGRVLVKSILQRDESSGGGSTITQQLAKNLYPRKRYWIFPMLINKMREVRTAQKLEGIYSKEELLTLYLNTVPFADNVFGIEAAAERFYSVNASELTTDQAAVLIGMLKATHSYNPRLFPDRALKRRNTVINRMVRYNYLSRQKADSLIALPIDLQYNKVSHHAGLAPYFREFLKSELLTWCHNHENEDGDPYNIYTDGLKIYTTIDSKMQQYAEEAVAEEMAIIQNTFFNHWGKDKPWKGKEEVLEQAIQRSPRYQTLKEQGLSEEEIMEVLQKPIPMRLFGWEGEQEAVVSPVDSIIHHLQFLNAGFLAIEPETGKVKAWVGGIDHDFFQFDHVNVNTKRQVGSIFKPIVFAMAMEQGVSPCEFMSASQQTYIDKEGDKWTPRDTQNDYLVDYSVRGALAYSINTVSVKLIIKAGVDKTIALARAMGITSEIPDVPSISLGSCSVSLMEMTNVYAGFANQAVPVTPYYINAIKDKDGKVFDAFQPAVKKDPVLSKTASDLTLQMMRGVINEGTASKLRFQYGIHNDVAGKTGTTQSNADGWFMAITPKLAVGTWVGADDPRIRFRRTDLGQGSSTALPITAAFFKRLNRDPQFKELTAARFPSVPPPLQEKLSCEIFQLNDSLVADIKRSIVERDSIINSDTTATAPPETFLQVLYKRKLRRIAAQQRRDSLASLPEVIE